MSRLLSLLLAAGAGALALFAVRKASEPPEREDTREPSASRATVRQNRRAYNPGSAIFSNELAFDLPDGRTVYFTVHGEGFRSLLPGEEGQLSWMPTEGETGGYFIAFDRDDGVSFTDYMSSL